MHVASENVLLYVTSSISGFYGTPLQYKLWRAEFLLCYAQIVVTQMIYDAKGNIAGLGHSTTKFVYKHGCLII